MSKTDKCPDCAGTGFGEGDGTGHPDDDWSCDTCLGHGTLCTACQNRGTEIYADGIRPCALCRAPPTKLMKGVDEWVDLEGTPRLGDLILRFHKGETEVVTPPLEGVHGGCVDRMQLSSGGFTLDRTFTPLYPVQYILGTVLLNGEKVYE